MGVIKTPIMRRPEVDLQTIEAWLKPDGGKWRRISDVKDFSHSVPHQSIGGIDGSGEADLERGIPEVTISAKGAGAEQLLRVTNELPSGLSDLRFTMQSGYAKNLILGGVGRLTDTYLKNGVLTLTVECSKDIVFQADSRWSAKKLQKQVEAL